MTTYLFDIGNVLALASHRIMIEALVKKGVARERAERFFELDSYWDFHKGKIDEKTYAKRLNEDIGIKLPMKEWRKLHDEHIYEIDMALMGIIDALAAKGHGIGFVTNTNAWQTNRIEEELVPAAWHRTLESYGPVFRSDELRMIKTQDDCFPAVLKKLGIKATEAVFIDDNAENVAKARSYGMRGIVYKDPAQLAREIGFY